jgi:hypothetical protein
MKKIITLVLALALVLTSVVAIAESVEAPAAPKGTPNIKSFATMTTKYNEGDGVITIKLDKPVDRLLVKWAEKGAEPEELAVGEDLTATALTWGHKYMPGTEQKLGTSTIKDSSEVIRDEKATMIPATDVKPSEWVYKATTKTSEGSRANPAYFLQTTTKSEKNPIYTNQYKDKDGKVQVEYALEYYDEAGHVKYEWADNIDYLAWFYETKVNPGFASYEVNEPSKVIVTKNDTDKFGNPITVEVDVKNNKNSDWSIYEVGSIQGVTVKTEVNKKLGTVIATPAQTAYMTVQGEWAVYYNRAGKIVGIELFDGQF